VSDPFPLRCLTFILVPMQCNVSSGSGKEMLNPPFATSTPWWRFDQCFNTSHCALDWRARYGRGIEPHCGREPSGVPPGTLMLQCMSKYPP
jgi:hypothetical protein